jgi:hypothetical protein
VLWRTAMLGEKSAKRKRKIGGITEFKKNGKNRRTWVLKD